MKRSVSYQIIFHALLSLSLSLTDSLHPPPQNRHLKKNCRIPITPLPGRGNHNLLLKNGDECLKKNQHSLNTPLFFSFSAQNNKKTPRKKKVQGIYVQNFLRLPCRPPPVKLSGFTASNQSINQSPFDAANLDRKWDRGTKRKVEKQR